MGKTKKRSKLSALRKQRAAYARPENQYAHETVARLSSELLSTLEKEVAISEKAVARAAEKNPKTPIYRQHAHRLKRLKNLHALWLELQMAQSDYLVAIKTRMLLEARRAPKVSMHWGSLEGLVTTPHQAHVVSTHPQHKEAPPD